MTSRTSSGKKKKDFRFFLFPFILFIFFSLSLSLSLAFSLTFSASFHPPLSLSPQRLPGRARAHPRLVPRLQDPRRQAREQVRVRAERISFLCSRFFFLSSFSLLLSLLLLSPLSPLLSLSLSQNKKNANIATTTRSSRGSSPLTSSRRPMASGGTSRRASARTTRAWRFRRHARSPGTFTTSGAQARERQRGGDFFGALLFPLQSHFFELCRRRRFGRG